jgi:hypothetical protein
MFLWLDYQFLPREELEKILGEEDYVGLMADKFYAQPVDVMLKQYLFQPMGSSTTAIREVRIQQVMQAYQLFNQDPQINQTELKKMVLDVLELKNQSKLLLPPPSVPDASVMGGAIPGTGQEEGQGGPPMPQLPQPPKPGGQALQPEEMMAQMAGVAGGGLIKTGNQTPQGLTGG